ncbi:MAG: deaminase [Chloroflexi bacterium RBG_16_54_18]|nr:MAG: deaminase [Chloroflexi bacterium RBG_16_54_18]
MRKVLYTMGVSLDGYIEDADGSLSWHTIDDELHSHFNRRESLIDMHLYGRQLYENMAAYWPEADKNPSAPQVEVEYAEIWRNKPKVVFSSTLKQVEWNSRLVSGDTGEEVRRLKEQPGNYMVVGGAQLASALVRLGLVDEFWLYFQPVVLGSGKPMFQSLQEAVRLELVDSQRFGCGVVLLKYQTTGDEQR